MHNCDLVNLEDMLQNGTVISGTLIEKPHSFSTACNIATQIIAQVASNQYGGQSISPDPSGPLCGRQPARRSAARSSRRCSDLGIDAQRGEDFEIVENRLREEIKPRRADHPVSGRHPDDHQRPGPVRHRVHVPERGRRTSRRRRDLAIIIEEMLRQRYQGVKNEKGVWITPAFPKLIYVLEDDNIHEDDPYYYLTKLAAKCTAKRMVPDYISEKKMLEYKVDKNGEGHCFTCMGCRSFLTPYVDENGKPKYYGRFNQGVVTINLVDVALSCRRRHG